MATDRAIAAIGAEEELSFAWLRATFKVDKGLKDTLNWGHAVIDRVDGLDQYLYTYGPMIKSQWECVAPWVATIGSPARWVDYGCGQGLAGLLVHDLTGGRLPGGVRDVVLIEPSTVALARAAAVYARIAPAATVRPMAKRFDEVGRDDFPSRNGSETVHVFSNSLDVLGFDPIRLLDTLLRPGRHTILSVSHDRGFNGGTPRIERVKAAVEASAGAGRAILRSTLDHFRCTNPNRSEGVVWLCQLEVRDG